MTMLFSLIVVQIIFSVYALAATGSGPIVNLGYAQYQGALNTTLNITSFLGIRYAAPPVGKTHSYPLHTTWLTVFR